MLSTKSGFDNVKQARSRTIQTSGANRFVRGSASPSMRERRVNTVFIMPYVQGRLQAHSGMSIMDVAKEADMPHKTSKVLLSFWAIVTLFTLAADSDAQETLQP